MKGATTKSKTSKSTGSKRGPGRPRGSTNKKTSTSSRSSTSRKSPANSRGGRARFGTFVNATDGMPTKADPMGKAVVHDDAHTNTGSCSLVYGDCVGDDAQIEGELKALRNETSSNRRKNFDQQHNKTHNKNNATFGSTTTSSSQLSGLHSKDISGHYTLPRIDHSKKFHTLRSPAQLMMTSRLVVPFSQQQNNFSSVNFIIQDDVSARGMGSNAASSTASQQKQQQQQQQKQPQQQQPKTMSSGNQHRENQQEQQQQYHKTGAGTTGTTRGSTAAHAEKPTQRHDTRQNPFFNKTSTTSSHMKDATAAVGQQNQSRGFSTRIAIKAFMNRHFSTQRGPVQQQQQQHHDQHPQQQQQQQQQQSRRDGDNKKNTTTASTTSSPTRNEKLHKKVDSTLNNKKSVDVSEEKF